MGWCIMPVKMERALIKEAKKKGWWKGGKPTKRGGAYIYGTMRKTGWKPSREK
jgi:hypothetical protein